jgi:hypothetical protein
MSRRIFRDLTLLNEKKKVPDNQGIRISGLRLRLSEAVEVIAGGLEIGVDLESFFEGFGGLI